MGNSNSDFDLDFRDGKVGEELVRAILSNEVGTVEVKRDFKVSNSGNVAIEYRCWRKLSGISVTKALWWAIILDGTKYGHEVVIIIKTDRLKAISKYWYKRGMKTTGGDDNASEMVLVPVGQLVTWSSSIVQPVLV